jgi:hypothetical protein
MTEPTLPEHIAAFVEEMREPLGLDRWDVRVIVGPLTDSRANCGAQPEYKEATITVDLDRLQTGDDLEELLCHELCHALIWPLHNVAEYLAPENARFQQEMIREAAERVTTDVGQIVLRYYRRLKAANTEIARLKDQLDEEM